MLMQAVSTSSSVDVIVITTPVAVQCSTYSMTVIVSY
jgi:hypothetical protein